MSCKANLWLNTCMPLKSSLRSTVYHTEKVIQQFRFRSQSNDLPVLLGISFPKSGTHLLDQILLQGEDSRLWQRLVQERGYSDSVAGGTKLWSVRILRHMGQW